MPPRRRAQLLLPSPLGLVEYDVLEDAVFLGPAPRGGLNAQPTPFKQALVAMTATPRGFVVRALPGEDTPTVNGRPADETPLGDGDEIGIGDVVAMVRMDGAPRSAPPARSTRSESQPPRRRQRPAKARTHPAVTAVSLLGVLVLLFAVVRAVAHLMDLKAGEQVRVEIPAPPEMPEARAAGALEPAARDYASVAAYEREHPEDLDGAVARYREYLRRHAGNPHAARARARIREIIDVAAAKELVALKETVETFAKERRFTTALKKIRGYERKYGATKSGQATEALRRQVRERARSSLDALLSKVGPKVSSDPRGAHRALLAAGPEFPPDLASEITELMERALRLMRSSRPPPEPPMPREPGPGGPGIGPTPLDPREPAGPSDGIVAEAEALAQWLQAHADLVAGNYADAFQGYTLLVMRFGNTDTYRGNKPAIVEGRRVAKIGAQGPAGLLSRTADVRRDKIEVEYTFDDARTFDRDFSVEQPFPSDQPVRVKVDRGEVVMSGASGVFHMIVWEPDVLVEAQLVAELPRDFGILAVEDSDDFRAVMFNIGNTLFTLKKGAAARANPGHILWFMGQGVWSDADSDAIGYIKIAERQKVKLEGGDELNLELIRRGDRCEGGFQGKSDGVSLKGSVRGDDGGTMGAARIGIFTNTGAIRLKRLRILGKVNQAWFEIHLGALVEDVDGPPEK